MTFKRRRGATLGLVAVCVLVIIVLGVGFFILSQILGGGREVANATDAGVLTVARKCLSPTLINVQLPGGSDFIGFDPSNPAPSALTGKVDMLGINRVVAQSVIVALNAQEINTTTASQHAQSVANAAKGVAQQLRDLIQGGSSPLPAEFTGVAHSNNTKMFEGNKVQLTGLSSAFMRPGFSTNVYLTPNLISAINTGLPSNLTNQNPNRLKHSNNEDYMAGYVNFSVPAGTGTTVNIAGVPIFPRQKPHLVDVGEFNGASGDPFAGGNYIPPNAFKADSKTLESKSGGFGGAVACALVGALDQDFVARIPRGYVRIRNGEDGATNNGGIVNNPVVDGANDVFNNELWPPNGGGVDVTNNGVYALNSDGAGQSYINDWKTYNAADRGDDGVANGSFNNPPVAGVTPVQPPLPGATGAPLFTNGSAGSAGLAITDSGATLGFRAPTEADLRAINNVADDCDAFDGWDRRAECKFPADAGATTGDGSIVTALQGQTGASSQPVTTASNGYTAVEVQKHDLLSRRFGGGRCTSVVPIGATGMKKFIPTGSYCTPSSNVTFGAPGSPLDYINQIGNNGNTAKYGQPNGANCAQDVLTKIHARMRQVDPQVSLGAVTGALGSQTLELGETLYLYSPGPNQVQMISGSPAFYFDGNPNINDGATSSAIYNCEHQYNISNTIVNANKGGGPTCGSHGDANFHQAPFTDGPGYLPGIDRAVWTPASGWRNLLGDIEFQNEASGAGTFCKPN